MCDISSQEFGGLIADVKNIGKRLDRHYEKLEAIDNRLGELNNSVAIHKEKLYQLENPKSIRNWWQGGVALLVGIAAAIYEYLRRAQGG